MPYAGLIDYLCEMFTCTPDEAAELDEDLTFDVVRSRVARNAVWAFNTKGIEMTPAQNDTYKRLLDVLDARDKRLGIPEEL